MDFFYSNRNRYLLQNLKKGDIGSFETIYKMFQPKLFAFSYRYLKVYEDAEGLVQEVFIEIWKNRHKINVNLSISSYLFTITKNKIVDHFRRQRRQDLFINYLHNYVNSSFNPIENTEQKESSRNINKVIKNMPEKRKIVFMLNRKFGLNRKEIADFMDISENTVKNHLLEAVKYLKQVLHKENVLAILFSSIFINLH